jgi:hypothetical protein
MSKQNRRKAQKFGLLAFSALLVVALVAPGAGIDTLDIGNAIIPKGASDTVKVSFFEGETATTNVAVQLDIEYDGENALVSDDNGSPDCEGNDSIGKSFAFAFLPAGCSGTTCTHLRALVFSMVDTDTIPPNVELFSCRVSVPTGTAPGTYSLTMMEALGSDDEGNAQEVIMSDGFVEVPAGGC